MTTAAADTGPGPRRAGWSAASLLKVALAGLGLAVVALLVHRIGAAPIVATLERLTWWQFALLCLPYGVSLVADTVAWRFAFAHDRAPFLRLLGARVAGEALNVVGGAGGVAGEPVKAWLLRRDVPYAESVPSVIVAKTTITIGQTLFLLGGLALAVVTPAARGFAWWMLWLLAIQAVAVGGFVAAQVVRPSRRCPRLPGMGMLAGVAAPVRRLRRSLWVYYRRYPGRLSLSVGFHFIGVSLLALEALIALRALGVDASAALATVVEALGSGVRFVTFFVPANLGALEGANAAALDVLGAGAGVGIAFTLLRRARQAVWVAIGLAVLAAMEWTGRRVTVGAPRTS